MTEEEIDRAIATIREKSTIATVSSYLRSRGLHHSAGSWSQMINDRLKPCFANESLDAEDLRVLLRDAEDFGHQHVFVFEANSKHPGSQSQLDPKRIDKFLSEKGWEELENHGKVIGLPKSITAVDIWRSGDHLSFKFIEPRTIIIREVEEMPDGTQIIRPVERTVRAVDVVTILDGNLLEFRIGTHEGTPDYSDVLEQLWDELDDFISREEYRPKSLAKAKRAFTISPSAEVRRLVRVRRASGIDGRGYGYTLKSLRPDGNILEAENVVSGIETIAANPSSQPGHTSIGFLPQADSEPARELGVIFPNALNEYRVLLNCTSTEHDYIRAKIRQYS